MSDNNDRAVVTASLFGFLAGALFMGIVMTGGMWAMNCDWQRESIKHGHAEYHQTTGQWQWKQPPEASDADD